MFRIGALAHGLDPIEVPLDARWQLDVDATCAAIREHQPNVIFLATPNNPTGNAFDEKAIETIAREAESSLVVIDEAYRAFADHTLSRLFGAYANVGMLGTLSKIGLAAARIGWARLPRALAVEVDKARQPYNLNALSQRVGCLALGPLAAVLEEHVSRIVLERERLGDELAQVQGLEVFPSVANFFLVRAAGDVNALHEWLADRGILVRNFHPHGGALAGCLRITVGTPAENDRLIEALRSAIWLGRKKPR
jgi:histidinol-phosphate aminotransferase